MDILFATTNQGKVSEIENILEGLDLRFHGLREFPDLPPVKEDGTTFRENAVRKATAYHKLTGSPSLAEDSGLEIDFLQGRPGIHSSRFAGEQTGYPEKMRRILEMLADVPAEQRGARFVCWVAFVSSTETHMEEGVCKGTISFRPQGEQGFGYDPIFIPEGCNRTFGQLDRNVKNQISHRSVALRKMRRYLESLVS